MPLIATCSIAAFKENIATEIRAGKPREQAVAIAHDTLRKACEEAGKPVPHSDASDTGVHVLRYDVGNLGKPVRTPNGYLRCDARITKVGVFEYRQADGSVRRELRLPREVFNDDSLSSFEDVPLTNNHPREKLTAKNTRKWQSGNVKRVRKDDKYVAAQVLITDEDAIKEAETGKTQLSCGYTCDLDFTPGITFDIEGIKDGLHYDAVQRNIVGNHVAIVDKGRAGSEASLHLDAEDAAMVCEWTPEPKPTGPVPGPVGGKPMVTMKIDGVDFEMSEPAVQAVTKLQAHLDELKAEAEKARDDLAKEKARADKAEEDLTAEKKAREDALSEDKIRNMVKARVALETTAAGIVKEDDMDLGAMSELDIKKAVIIAVSPSAKEKLDGADDAYVDARYDAALEVAAEQKKDEPKDKAVNKVKTATMPVGRQDSVGARDRMIERHRQMGRDPIVPSPIPSA